MWTCGTCGREFANRNQVHTCALLRTLEEHFVDKDPAVRETFDTVVATVARLGPVTVLPERTRIALQVRMSFAAFVPRRRWLDGHVVLSRRREHARFRTIEVYSPRNVVHTFRLYGPDDVDAEVEGWLTEAYAVGRQDHLRS